MYNTQNRVGNGRKDDYLVPSYTQIGTLVTTTPSLFLILFSKATNAESIVSK